MSKDEELFSIRLPDGTRCNWTIGEIMTHQSAWKAELCQGDGVLDEADTGMSREAIRQMIREEIDRLLPTITERVSAGLTRAIRMREGRKS